MTLLQNFRRREIKFELKITYLARFKGSDHPSLANTLRYKFSHEEFCHNGKWRDRGATPGGLAASYAYADASFIKAPGADIKDIEVTHETLLLDINTCSKKND